MYVFLIRTVYSTTVSALGDYVLNPSCTCDICTIGCAHAYCGRDEYRINRLLLYINVCSCVICAFRLVCHEPVCEYITVPVLEKEYECNTHKCRETTRQANERGCSPKHLLESCTDLLLCLAYQVSHYSATTP